MRSFLAVLLLAPALAGSAPKPAQLVYSLPTHRHVVALTFDAGADRGYAPRILWILHHNKIHATFGVTGLWAEENPDLVRRMAHYGEQVINHTFDHRSFTGLSTHAGALSRQQRAWEIEHAEKVIRRLTGRTTKPFFRPPYGDLDPATRSLAGRLGYRFMLMWTVDTLGWEGLSAQQIVSRTMTLTQPGAILLMHVGAQSRDGLALPQVIRLLRHRGYRFVTVGQLLH